MRRVACRHGRRRQSRPRRRSRGRPRRPPGRRPRGQHPRGQHPPGQHPPGQRPPGQRPPGPPLGRRSPRRGTSRCPGSRDRPRPCHACRGRPRSRPGAPDPRGTTGIAGRPRARRHPLAWRGRHRRRPTRFALRSPQPPHIIGRAALAAARRRPRPRPNKTSVPPPRPLAAARATPSCWTNTLSRCRPARPGAPPKQRARRSANDGIDAHMGYGCAVSDG